MSQGTSAVEVLTASPTVAIVITTYDHAHFLARAIESALAQTHPADQVLVIDDGSHDDPAAVVARFPGVRLIRQGNAGLAEARNTGWRSVDTDFVVFLDADDRLLPPALAVNSVRLAEDPRAAFAYGAYVDVHASSGKVVDVAFRPATDGYHSFLRGNVIGMHATVMYRRALLAGIGGYTAGLPACEDYDLYLRLSRVHPVVFGPEQLAEYWHHGANMSKNAAFMLRAALGVLRTQREHTRASDARVAYRQGVAEWRRYYSEVWWLQTVASSRARRVDREVVRQGVSLMRQAPFAMVTAPCRFVARRVVAAAGGCARRARRGARR